MPPCPAARPAPQALAMIEARLSVVIPTYNNAQYLTDAVASVRAQRWPDTEIIIVDDGSTDGTPDVAAAWPDVAYVRQANAGIGAARNRGVEAATGRWLAFLDADDCWADDKIARQMAYLDEHRCDMVFGLATEVCDGDDVKTRTWVDAGKLRQAIVARCAGTMLIAREAFDRAGPFPTALRVGEFIDWYLRAVEVGVSGGVLEAIVLYRRVHADNGGWTAGDGRQDYLRIIKGALDRRRAAARRDDVT
jgi:glycosyltransferase involved in cell wall biosynthesis